MNLDKLFTWIAGMVLSFALIGKLDALQVWIWRAQAKVIYESRTSNWRSPRFFPAKKILNSKLRKDVFLELKVLGFERFFPMFGYKHWA